MNGKIIFCDTVQVSRMNGTTSANIKAPLNAIKPVAIPGNYSFAVYGCVTGIKHITDDEKLTFAVFMPDGSHQGDIEIPLKNTPLNEAGDEYRPVEIAIDFRNIVIPAEGEITAVFSLDGSEICRSSIDVIKE